MCTWTGGSPSDGPILCYGYALVVLDGLSLRGEEEQSIQSRNPKAFHTPNKTKLVLPIPIKTQSNKSKHYLLNVLLCFLVPPHAYLTSPEEKRKGNHFLKDGDQIGFDFFCFMTAPEKHRYSSITKAWKLAHGVSLSELTANTTSA